MQYPLHQDTIQEARTHFEVLKAMHKLFGLLDECAEQQFVDFVYKCLQQRTWQLDEQEELRRHIQEYELEELHDFINGL